MQYNTFRLIYPPRAETKVSPANISNYDNGQFIGQPKYNGACTILFLNEGEQHFYNRDGTPVDPKWTKDIDLYGIYSGKGWMIVCGELMNKAKYDEHNQKLTGFVIWDILAHNGNYLIGETVEKRLTFLELLFPSIRNIVTPAGELREYEHLCFTGVGGVYKAPTYTKYFDALYKDLVKTDAYEGLVLKKAMAPLDFGFNEKNNSKWQVKIRKQTKNYHF